ncbi:large-conductance mechanosensitive channel protein MscL [Tissierella carlieri]|uniref:Large-conductance mechanosensitive channel n=1 Tax=Tissierella carlieri TaxID=689904 RepID=A0ABT1S9X5_9FIRM|nr:large-conductance mechanosensitive channel protein MscL [Tissierella carlieri]MBU5311429.1 large-conductance mechanosensitive channel protein MscL [Tissierella carlieri]MCQ4923277.1 large-conductance mechanosensitive channel protein MscL [Tissierella carlieri]MDU5080674.1 large-conductance mechanosensitive channel protein MscL [Bacillota bacterium]
MLKEFKEFAVKGNVIDLAVGVIIGGAFGKIVTSLVNDMIMPVIGLLIKNVNFTDLFISLDGNYYPSLAAAQGAPTINYGIFINTILEFLIISFSIFIVIRQLNRLKRKEEVVETVPTTKACPYCYTEIHIDATRCPNCTSIINEEQLVIND